MSKKTVFSDFNNWIDLYDSGHCPREIHRGTLSSSLQSCKLNKKKILNNHASSKKNSLQSFKVQMIKKYPLLNNHASSKKNSPQLFFN